MRTPPARPSTSGSRGYGGAYRIASTADGTVPNVAFVDPDGTLRALGKCMDGTANGTRVQLYDCNGTGARQWTREASSSLVNPASGRCLDATGPSSANGTGLQIGDCTGAADRQWTPPG